MSDEKRTQASRHDENLAHAKEVVRKASLGLPQSLNLADKEVLEIVQQFLEAEITKALQNVEKLKHSLKVAMMQDVVQQASPARKEQLKRLEDELDGVQLDIAKNKNAINEYHNKFKEGKITWARASVVGTLDKTIEEMTRNVKQAVTVEIKVKAIYPTVPSNQDFYDKENLKRIRDVLDVEIKKGLDANKQALNNVKQQRQGSYEADLDHHVSKKMRR